MSAELIAIVVVRIGSAGHGHVGDIGTPDLVAAIDRVIP